MLRRRFLASISASRVTLLICCVSSLLLVYILAYSMLVSRVLSAVRANERAVRNESTIAVESRTGDRDLTVESDNASLCRQKRDAFGSARLPTYSRSGIVIPEWSNDTRECDDFHSARNRECLVADGYTACFDCVESRSSLRVCAHVSESVTIYDEAHQTEVTLEPNSSPLLGYCLRETLAEQLRELHEASDDSTVVQARRQCSIHNADWVLVRKRATQNVRDSSFNFVCKCKYPHLMANATGPMSACSRAVGCNGHGELDRASRDSEVDPFVEGRCVCDAGWIAEYDARAGIGPRCREATIGEWPSMLLGRSDDNREPDDTYRYIDLHSRYVDEAFRRILTQSRVDNGTPVYLRNPCHPCPIVATDDGRTYFCGDKIETIDDQYGRPVIIAAYIGVRGDRDYLRENGGRFPNACLSVTESQIVSDRILVQFMTQERSKDLFAMEIGIITKRSVVHALTGNELIRSRRYETLRQKLIPPALDTFNMYGVIWTFSHSAISKHRERVCESLRSFLSGGKYTNLAYGSSDFRVPYSFYVNNILTNSYYYFPAGHSVERAGVSQAVLIQHAYKCPDDRGLDVLTLEHGLEATETNEDAADRIARAMLPVCLIDHTQRDDGAKYLRPEINCNHANDSACVIFQNDGLVTYMSQLWIPSDMRMLKFCEERCGWRGDEKEINKE